MALNVIAAKERYDALAEQYRKVRAAYNSTFPNPPAVKEYRYKRLCEIIGQLMPLSLQLHQKGIINL